jgi:ATP-dependent DNA helicase RecQ
VCDPDEELRRALQAPIGGRRRAGGASARVTASAVESSGEPVDEAQFDRLRAWRWERAEGKPAYTVAPNSVLEEVLRRRPGNRGELLEIRGVGPAFWEKHGEALLQELAAL